MNVQYYINCEGLGGKIELTLYKKNREQMFLSNHFLFLLPNI